MRAKRIYIAHWSQKPQLLLRFIFARITKYFVPEPPVNDTPFAYWLTSWTFCPKKAPLDPVDFQAHWAVILNHQKYNPLTAILYVYPSPVMISHH